VFEKLKLVILIRAGYRAVVGTGILFIR